MTLILLPGRLYAGLTSDFFRMLQTAIYRTRLPVYRRLKLHEKGLHGFHGAPRFRLLPSPGVHLASTNYCSGASVELAAAVRL